MALKALKTPSWLAVIFVSFILATHLPTACLAQDKPVSSNGNPTATADAMNPDPSSSTTSSAPTQTHTIQVGLADHVFKPDVTNASIGDTIEFLF
ncbi:hypothetical protein N0V83_010269 [Neocucurbitaria cava]|uniref:Uncharacterized protein n=1 Tax=Neocucurbitaria cava TaxID=798079 RepID=A0A9W8XYJ1_9PLEO|nr:hypothetical protein N0V83_010269 [Neocucurbitaria cava]